MSARVTELEAIVSAHQLAHGEAPRRWLRGWLEAHRGRPREGHELIISGLAAQERLGTQACKAEILGHAAEALMLAGDFDAAHCMLEGALDLATETREGVTIPYLQLLCARCLIGMGRRVDARALAEEALRTARAQQSKWYEKGALHVLQLCTGHEHGEPALPMLSDVVDDRR